MKSLIFICFLILVSQITLTFASKSRNFLREETSCKGKGENCAGFKTCCHSRQCYCVGGSLTNCQCGKNSFD